nr:MAG TPA: hypothetical protein [Caudoviricetes sp.]
MKKHIPNFATSNKTNKRKVRHTVTTVFTLC